MWKPFEKYISVSIVNTLFHWISFSFFVYALACSQSFDNLLAFLIAVSFGFIANARWAFKNEATKKRYFLFFIFMGILAWLTGKGADKLHFPLIVTLVTFSFVKFTTEFIDSKLVVLREKI